MLSHSDAQRIQDVRQLLDALQTISEREARTTPSNYTSFTYGRMSGYLASADHALAAVLTHAATYLDDVHAEAALSLAKTPE